jgi:hypothetical protein
METLMRRASSGKISMTDKGASVGIALHTVALDHGDAVPDRPAEVMIGIGGHRHHNPMHN